MYTKFSVYFCVIYALFLVHKFDKILNQGDDKMLRYRFDIINKLKERGYTTYKIRRENIFAQVTLTKFRTGQVISADNLDRLCKLLQMQPGDILEYVPDDEGN